MITSAIGATLPVQAAAPAVDGEVVDPAASLPFLAALAAAVAAALPPPAPAPVIEAPLPVLDVGTAEGDDEAVGVSAEEDGAAATPGDYGSARPTSEATADATGTRLRVLIADRAAPSPTAAAAPEVEASVDGVVDSGDTDADAADIAGAARADRSTPSTPAPQTSTSGNALPPVPNAPAAAMWQAALQAPAVASRGDATAQAEAPPAPVPSAPRAAGDVGARPGGAAVSTAAGVLAALHAAHLAHDDGTMPSASATSAPFDGQVAAGVLEVEVVGDADAPSGAVMRAATIAEGDGAEPALLPAALRVVVPARPSSAGTEQEMTGERQSERGGDEPQVTTPVVADAIELPLRNGPSTLPAGEAAPMPTVADGARPTAEVRRTTEPPAAPPSPTSQVTVELDAEQTGAQRVRVAVRGDVVHATLVTDQRGVEALRPQLDELRHALEGQGFREAHVQVRAAGDGSAGVVGGGSAEFRLRNDAPTRAPDGSSSEQQPRGRQRGQDQQPPQGGQPEYEEEIL